MEKKSRVDGESCHTCRNAAVCSIYNDLKAFVAKTSRVIIALHGRDAALFAAMSQQCRYFDVCVISDGDLADFLGHGEGALQDAEYPCAEPEVKLEWAAARVKEINEHGRTLFDAIRKVVGQVSYRGLMARGAIAGQVETGRRAFMWDDVPRLEYGSGVDGFVKVITPKEKDEGQPDTDEGAAGEGDAVQAEDGDASGDQAAT
jgi:hypothetical protein